MTDALLILNVGSSTIKFALFEHKMPVPERPVLSGQIDGLDACPRFKAKDSAGRLLDDVDLPFEPENQHRQAFKFLIRWLRERGSNWRIVGVGHRVVHGAQRFSQPVLLDDATIGILRGFIPLAPLHQPHNLAGIDEIAAALPGIPQVACFDTAFHRTQSELAQRLALPRRITDQGVRRYGFHGLSYEYIADALPKQLGDRADGRVIVAHLGNGASLCALQKRRSIATTMSFTALDGLVMGTRCGNLDPGVLLYLIEFQGMGIKELNELLYKESGLLGVSGISQDMRELLASERPEAREAVDLFCYCLVRELGSMAAALRGVDALVFTGGIGEHAAVIRQRVCAACSWLGIALDPDANDANALRVSTPDSAVDVLVIPTNEEWIIARHTADLIG
ncbi:MAG: acetate/propionate family kinase [Zoogloeaceae bacterium]|jgi:acetate kinase|nr:acetate/propionate family kinase [Zoogloeaceae bacterium]